MHVPHWKHLRSFSPPCIRESSYLNFGSISEAFIGPLEVAVSVTPLHLRQHFDKYPACIDTQKVHINYIKFQSLLQCFLHIKYVNLEIALFHKKGNSAVALCGDRPPINRLNPFSKCYWRFLPPYKPTPHRFLHTILLGSKYDGLDLILYIIKKK